VLSNKPHDPTKAIVKQLFGGDRFRLVYGQRKEAPKKPDPTVALAMAGLMDVDPAECLFVGDTLIDMETARSSGMYGVGVLWGFRPREELVRHGARALLAHPSDLLDLIEYGIESRVCLDPL
jgi:phosphoglycolate phosphatase